MAATFLGVVGSVVNNGCVVDDLVGDLSGGVGTLGCKTKLFSSDF